MYEEGKKEFFDHFFNGDFIPQDGRLAEVAWLTNQ